jgi:hypothetical protein
MANVALLAGLLFKGGHQSASIRKHEHISNDGFHHRGHREHRERTIEITGSNFFQCQQVKPFHHVSSLLLLCVPCGEELIDTA